MLSDGARNPQEARWEYEDVMLVTNVMSPAQLFELLERLIEKGELHLPDLPPLVSDRSCAPYSCHGGR